MPIGNTEEKHETRQSNEHHAKDSKGLRPKNRRNQIQTKRIDKKRNGGKRMNKYQKWLISHMVNVSYATRKLG